eukprot:g5563.t1
MAVVHLQVAPITKLVNKPVVKSIQTKVTSISPSNRVSPIKRLRAVLKEAEDLSSDSQSTQPISGFDRYRRLRDAVIIEEKAAYMALVSVYRRSDLNSLIKQGTLLTELTAQSDGNLYRMFKIKLKNDRNFPRHRFSNGDTATLSRVDQNWDDDHDLTPAEINERKFDVLVHEVKRNELTVLIDSVTHDRFQKANPRRARWRLDARFQNTTCLRQVAAIDKLLAFDWTPDPVHALQAEILGLPIPTEVESRLSPQLVTSTKLTKRVEQLTKEATNLNHSQKEAINAALRQRITLWQGPPGSGKTYTLLTLLTILCEASRSVPRMSPFPVLVCAETNTAVDNLVFGLLRRKVRVVRIGAPSRTRELLLSSTLEARAERTVFGQQYLDTKNKIQKLRDFIREVEESPIRNEAVRAIRKLSGRSEILHRQACDAVLDSCEVVACTCGAAGDASLIGRSFSIVIVDEATQSTEPCTLVPLLFGAQLLVMAGDPQQLPPTILSKEALDAGLGYTLFARLVSNGVEPFLLDTQYRMHPEICRFPSIRFYKGKLHSSKRCWRNRTPKWFAVNYNTRVVFIESRSAESRSASLGQSSSSSSSYYNSGEAQLVISKLKKIIRFGDVKSVALLTPYKGQELLLEELVDESKDLKTAQLCVSTVDGFQGREADVVIFSTVRCNPQRTIGFVADARRVNVAMTRAKRGLVVVGNRATLYSNPLWRSWLNWVDRQSQSQ